MTWSIVARDPETGLYGIAIASRFFAVGAVCPWTAGKAGAISTQALVNPALGALGLALMGDGIPAPAVLDMMIGADQGRAARQVHLIDAAGRTAAYTGAECVDWAGDRTREGVSVAGNMLAGAAVVEDTLATYLDNMNMPFVERLLAALDAGQAAGGDKRGKQSAALRIQGPEPYTRLDMRVDDHAEPFVELRRLYEVARERFIPFSRAFPTPERPYGITDRALIEMIIERDTGKSLTMDAPIPEVQ
jgi:uncharacterized Ntn-hydrolase superfamily protein